MSNFNARKVFVEIERDRMDVVAKPVFEHEVEILKEMHGDAAIKVRDVADLELDANALLRPVYKGEKPAPGTPPDSWADTFELDEGAEYSRLTQVYGMHKEYNRTYVEEVFGPLRRSRLAKEYHVEGKRNQGPTKKEKLQEQMDAMGMDYEGMTIADMEEAIAAVAQAEAGSEAA